MDHIQKKAEDMIRQAEKKEYSDRVERALNERLAKVPNTIEDIEEALRQPKATTLDDAKKEFELEERRDFTARVQTRLHQTTLEEKRELLARLKDVAAKRKTSATITKPMFEKLQTEIDELVAKTPPEPPKLVKPDFSKVIFDQKVDDSYRERLRRRLSFLRSEQKRNEDIKKWKKDYKEYAEKNGVKVETDFFEDLVNACNLHRQNYLLADQPDFDCPCEGCGPMEGEDDWYGNYVDFGEYPQHFFRYGQGRCSFGTKVMLEFDEEDMELGFIERTVPMGRVVRY